jgi:hypothetical protein
MAASLDKSTLEETLRFSIVNLEKFDKEVAVFSRLAQRALFCPDQRTREKAQARIHNRYGRTIQNLDIDDERIVFTIRSVKKILGEKPEVEEYSCALCKLPEYLLDQPYHEVLFSE